MNESSPLLSYKAKKQNIVAVLLCEAEYVAMTAAIQEAKFLGQLLADVTCTVYKPVNLFVDNQVAIDLAKNPIHHQCTKHIYVKNHFIRSEVKNGFISLECIPTDKKVADLFTKPMSLA